MSLPEPELDELYRELILDHYRNPRNREPLESPAVVTEGYNPLCGDEVELQLNFDGDVISEVSCAGRGCSISQASASMLTDAVKGKTMAQARALISADRTVSHGRVIEVIDLVKQEGLTRFAIDVERAEGTGG